MGPRQSRSGGLQAVRETGEQLCLRVAGGKRDAHAGGSLGDAGCDLDQAHPQGGELGGAKRLRSGNCVAHSQHHPAGTSVQHEADLVGQR